MAILRIKRNPFEEDFKDYPIAGPLNISEAILEGFHIEVNGLKISNPKYFELSDSDLIIVYRRVEDSAGARLAIALGATFALGFAGAPVAAALGITNVSAVSSALVIAGSLLINSTILKPKESKGHADNETYRIQGGQNQARQNSSVPILYGKTKIIPDLAALPFAIDEGDDSYLYQIFSLGLVNNYNDIIISDEKLGDTLLTNFSDYTTTSNASDWSISATQFPGNVDSTILSLKIDQKNQYERQNSSTETHKIIVQLTGTIFGVRSSGEVTCNGRFLIYRIILYPIISGVPDHDNPIFGGYEDVSGLDGSHRLQCDEESPTKPKLFSIAFDGLDEGQYEIEVQRISDSRDYILDKIVANRGQGEFSVTWTGIQSFQKDSGTYNQVQRRALKVKASGQLNGVIDNYNFVGSSKMLDWNGSSWVLAETSNTSSCAYHMLKGIFDEDTGELIYGFGLSDSDIDLDSFQDFHDFCASKGYECNLYEASDIRGFELLDKILATARGKIDTSSGLFKVVWEAPNKPVLNHFSSANIIGGSVSINYLSSPEVDGFRAKYQDEDNEYTEDELIVYFPGASPLNPVNIQDVRFDGVTNKTQVAGFTNLLVASQYLLNRKISFQVDKEGLVNALYDTVALSHPLLGTDAISGRLSLNQPASLSKIYLDRDINFTAGMHLILRHNDGTIEQRDILISGSPLASSGSPQLANIVLLSSDLDQVAEPEIPYTIFTGDPSLFSITEITPNGDKVNITCVDYTDSYFDSEAGGFDYTAPVSNLNSIAAEISNVRFSESYIDGAGTRVTLKWNLINSLRTSLLLKIGTQTGYVDKGIVGSQFVFDVNFASSTIEFSVKMRAIPLSGALRDSGQVYENTFTIKGPAKSGIGVALMPDVKGMRLENELDIQEWYGRQYTVSWDVSNAELGIINASTNISGLKGENSQFKDYYIEISDSETGDLLRKFYSKEPSFTYDIEKMSNDTGGVLIRSTYNRVWRRGIYGQLSQNPGVLLVNNPAPSAPSMQLIPGVGQVSIVITTPATDLDFDHYEIYASTSSGFTPGEGSPDNLVFYGSDSNILITDLDETTTYYFKAAAADVIGVGDFSSEYSTTTFTQDILPEFRSVGLIFEEHEIGSPIGSPVTSNVSWSAATFYLNGVQYDIDAGSVEYAGSRIYIGWAAGDTTISTTESFSESTQWFPLATYLPGELVVGEATPIITSSFIQGQTIGAQHLVTDTAVITSSAQLASAIINTAHINDAQITSAKINDLAVTTGKINDLAVTTGKINSLAVTTAKIDSLAVTAAKIANATITSAKIGTAQVETLNIGSNQVSIPISSYAAGASSTKTEADAYFSIQSASITSTGQPQTIDIAAIFILYAEKVGAGSDTEVDVYVKLARTGTSSGTLLDLVIWKGNAESGGNTYYIPFSFLIGNQTTAASAHTYTLYSKVTAGGNADAVLYSTNRTIRILEVKR